MFNILNAYIYIYIYIYFGGGDRLDRRRVDMVLTDKSYQT